MDSFGNFTFKEEICRNCFINMVVDEWNRFSNHVVSTSTPESLKRGLDNLIDEDEDDLGYRSCKYIRFLKFYLKFIYYLSTVHIILQCTSNYKHYASGSS